MQHDDVDTLVGDVVDDYKDESVTVVKQIRELIQQRQTVPGTQKSLFVQLDLLAEYS